MRVDDIKRNLGLIFEGLTADDGATLLNRTDLTPAERERLDLFLDGIPVKDIKRRQKVTAPAVNNSLSNAQRKLWIVKKEMGLNSVDVIE